MAKVQL